MNPDQLAAFLLFFYGPVVMLIVFCVCWTVFCCGPCTYYAERRRWRDLDNNISSSNNNNIRNNNSSNHNRDNIINKDQEEHPLPSYEVAVSGDLPG